MFKSLAYVFIFTILTACATTSGVNPDSMSKPASMSEFTLNEDVTDVMTVTNAFGSKTKMLSGLKKGRYVSKFEDAKGIYYEGPKGCVVQNNHNGGIYLPKKGSDVKPAFWFYIRGMPESERSKAGLVVAMGDRWEEGRVKKDWWTTISSVLLNAIQVK